VSPSESLRTGEDVDAILRIALQREHGSTDELRERLVRSADELGISPEALARAEEEYRIASKIDNFMQAKKAGFQAHLVSYVSVNVLLNVIWFLTSRNGNMMYWPGIVLAAWGIGIASHYFFRNQRPAVTDKHFQKWLEMGEPSSYSNDGDDD